MRKVKGWWRGVVQCAGALGTVLLPVPAGAQVLFDVNSSVDTPDAHLGDGVCDDGTGHCTLRAAVEEANARPGADVITLPADSDVPDHGFPLSYKEFGATSARLEILDDVTIEGSGAGETTVSGSLLSQIMQVRTVGAFVLDASGQRVLRYSFGSRVMDLGFSFAGTGSGAGRRLILGSEGFPDTPTLILATDDGVFRYSQGGQLLETLIPSSVGGQEFSPLDVVLGPFQISPNGHDQVFASNAAAGGGVYRYNPADKTVTRFVQQTQAARSLTWVLAPGPGGGVQAVLLVLYDDEHRIAKYDTNGTFIGNFATGLPDGELYMTNRGDRVYVGHGKQIDQYDLSGNPLGSFVASGSGGLLLSLGFHFAPDGSLFVCDPRGVLRFDGRTGAFGNVFAPAAGMDPNSPLKLPWDVVFVDGGSVAGPSVFLTQLKLAHGRRGELGGAGLGVDYGSFVRLQEAEIEDNQSGGLGAGIENRGLMDINRVRIHNNRTTQAAEGGETAVGGGIFNAGILLLSDSLVDGNFGGHGGGLATVNPGAEAQVSNTAFIANSASGGGAGVRAAKQAYVSLNFCTVTDNLVPDPITKSTKDPTPYGGGIFAEAGSHIDLGNSIVAGNSSKNSNTVDAPDCYGGDNDAVRSFTDNLIGTVNAACPILDYVTHQPPADLLTGDPLLGPLGNNGGPTDSRQPLDGSPAIDGDRNVSSFALFQCPAGDQRYFIRPGGSRCDIGSVEVLSNVAFDIDHDGIEDSLDLDPQAYSFSFADVALGGNTSGELISEGEQTIAIEDADSAGVTLSAAAGGGQEPALFSLCSDHVMIELHAGETRTVTCVTADAGRDQTVECSAGGKATVTLTGSGASLSGAPVSYGWASPGVTLQQATQAVATGAFSLGTHVVTLTVSRGADVTSDVAVVTVVDSTPPTLTVPPDVTTSTCTGVSIGQATASDLCGSVTITNDAPSSYRAGVRVITWRATDAAGNQTTATQRVVVGLGENQACCPSGYKVILGTTNNDTITGTSGKDCIIARGGQDTISGFGGDDIISGGDGDDVIDGGDGNDVIDGNAGQDILRGALGNDTLVGSGGDDQCFGGDGDDLVFGGDGQDRLYGENGNDTLYGEAGSDRLEGGAGNDTLNGGSSTDTCLSGGGTDTITACEL